MMKTVRTKRFRAAPSMRAAVLASVCALAGATALAAAPEEEPSVSVRLRTLGWNVQATFGVARSDARLQVYNSQFSNVTRYVGPPTVRLYRQSSGSDELLGVEPEAGSDSSAGNQAKKNGTGGKKAPPPMAASFQVPEGARELLLVFIPDPEPGPPFYRVATLDDSTAEPEQQNVHFYNLSAKELAVRAFGEIKRVAPGGQELWLLSGDAAHSTLEIAVKTPEARRIYSSRFRLRGDQRMVFIARGVDTDGERGPSIKVTSMLESVRPGESEPPAEAGESSDLSTE